MTTPYSVQDPTSGAEILSGEAKAHHEDCAFRWIGLDSMAHMKAAVPSERPK